MSMEAHRQQRYSKKRSATPRAQYAAQACQECRRRRAKCDGHKPSCARCLNRGMECVFNTRDDSRGTAPKSLVMQLQARIQQLEQVLWLHSIDVDTSIAQLKAGHLPSISPSHPQQQSREEEPVGALCANGPFGLSDKDGDEEEVRFFGSSSGRVELLQSTPLHSNSALASLPRASLRSGLNRFLQDPDLVPPVDEELQEHLIALYFQWEQPWLQLVDEQLFRQSLRQEGRYCSPLLLHCILAMGARYSERLEVHSTPDDPNTAGESLLEVAEVLLHFDLRSPSITTIQSLGIMAIFYVAIGSDSKGWLRHGMAIRLALDMGLNLDFATLERTHRFSEVEIKLRKQIYWSLYCTDKLWASYTGRVCTMLDSQSSVELPLSGVAFDDSKPTQILPMLLHSLSTHCQILEKILMKLYAPGKLPPGIQRTTVFDSCLLELKSWKYHLPVALQWKRAGGRCSSNPIMPHIFLLHMVYNTSIIILAKPFLSKPSLFRTAAAAPENPTMPGIPVAAAAVADIERKASSLCVEASRDICLLGEQYRKAFGGFRQSPITAMHCTFSAALFLILNGHHQDHEEPKIEPDARSKWIRSCLLTLRELGVSWTTATKYWHGLRCLLKDRDQQGLSLTRGLRHIEAIPSPRNSPTAVNCDDAVGEHDHYTPSEVTAKAAADGSSQWNQSAGQQPSSCLDMDIEAAVHNGLTFEEFLLDLPHDLGFLAAIGSSTPPDLWAFYE
ncbi:hypothetical protein ASPACDRAFT_1855924 [Aspergillus aculeatus ATCC 16872]|uniref:Zn(2)-C6 fungal-type domain-containing protein n=1 Tax=Aspergillus aculeatus (strain ATCC 16872 / CBS 172.66 / WB 5094) TaxID=690307 RepID=A0A1L9WWP3_ASPA1|nr:uncharacterized protein ASPACDRAFT_1855924 [Aspergillus aculeatus ATCC 16872]OJK00348.1 hypothetical protein ASPACDRAFT_1855924 [Aspergillus aculeatus ATCC 16872]